MESKEVADLKRTMARQKKAFMGAKKVWEKESKDLNDLIDQLKETNEHLERKLIEKDSEYEGFFLNIIDPYVVMDLKFNVIRMNSAAKEFLGYDHTKEPIDLYQLVHKDYRKYTSRSIRSLLKEGSLKNYRSRIFTKNKSEKFVKINGSLIYDENGGPIAIHGIIRDITQEYNRGQRLMEQKSELDVIVENSPLAIALTIGDKIVKINQAFVKLLGYSQSEIKKLLIKDISAPEDIPRFMDLMEKMVSGKIDNFAIEKKYIRKDGTLVWAKTNVNAVRNNDGTIKHQVAIIEDITLQREKNLIIELINDIARSILGKMDIREIALEIIKRVTKYLALDDCIIYLMDKKKQELVQIAASGKKVDDKNQVVNSLKIAVGEGIVGSVASTGKAEIIGDTTKDKRYIVDDKRRYSEITVPIISEGEVIGVIDSEHDQRNYYTKAHLDTLQNVANVVGMQLKNAINLEERRKAEEHLKASESILSTVISNLHAGVLLEDGNRNISLTNQMFCTMFDIPLSPEEMIGIDCSKAIEEGKSFFRKPDEFIARVKEIVERGETVISDELELVDGRIFERDYIPIVGNDWYSGHLWTYSDVTIQRNHKKELEAQKEKFGSIIANMNLGLVEVDNEDTILLVNQSFCKLCGYTEEELLGQKAASILGVVRKDLVREKNVLRFKGISDSYELQVRKKSGELRHWLVSGAPRFDECGNTIGSIGIHLDITDQKNLKFQKEHLLKELEKSNRGLREYAHIVSHDLKSPLRSLSALTTWLNDDYREVLDGEGAYSLEMMQEKIEAMDRLIDGILKYSSIDGDGMESTPVDINAVVQNIREIIFIPEHVNVVIMNPLPIINADKTKIHQLFQNLISNAVINIEEEEGIVTISSKETPTHWEFGIQDNGIGIPEEYHEKIFEMFQSVRSDEGSTGLGLFIVKKIVNLYEGEIWLESELGKGTTFFFTLKKQL